MTVVHKFGIDTQSQRIDIQPQKTRYSILDHCQMFNISVKSLTISNLLFNNNFQAFKNLVLKV